jgi:hypothetical protein
MEGACQRPTIPQSGIYRKRMPGIGLEPTHLTVRASKTRVSTNFTTWAQIGRPNVTYLVAGLKRRTRLFLPIVSLSKEERDVNDRLEEPNTVQMMLFGHPKEARAHVICTL